MNEDKLISEQELDKVAGGTIGELGDEDTPKGIYRCAVCGWEVPGEHIPIPNMFPCKMCGGRLEWHQTSGRTR